MMQAGKCPVRKFFFLAALIVSYAGLGAAQSANAGMEMRQLDGELVDLDDYTGKGKWLLVMIWSTTCHICEQQKPSMSEFHSKHKDNLAEVVGIAIDGMENIDAVRANVKSQVTSFPSFVGELVIVASHYLGMTQESLRGTPTYLLFNPDGKLVGNNPGPMRIEALEQFIGRKSG